MNLAIMIEVLLVFGVPKAYSRAAEIDAENLVEASVPHSESFVMQDWIKFIKTPPAKLLQTTGSPVEIECEVMGSHVPEIQWVVGRMSTSELEDLELNAVDESSPTAIVRVRSIYLIEHLLNEPRTYTCVGFSGGKMLYASTTVYPPKKRNKLLQLTSKDTFVSRPPRIVYSERMHLELIGSNIVLPCKVAARPHPEVYWMNGRDELIEQNRRYKILPGGDLLISEINWKDMGVYKCIANNSLGQDAVETFVYPVAKENED